MSGSRRSTNSTLRVYGSFGDNETLEEESPSRSWIGAFLQLLHCNGRCEKWHAPNSSETPSEILETKNLRNSEELDFSWLNDVVSKVYKVLLVFPRDDQQSEILTDVARKLNWSVSKARNAEETGELFRLYHHDLVIVDRRGTVRSQDADNICRAFNNINNSRNCNIVALVKKTFFTIGRKNEDQILQLLNIGYDRAIIECSHKGILMNELIGFYKNRAQPKNQLAAAQLLYFFIDSSQDIIHVTNDQHIIQFTNKASETIFGYKEEEFIGKKIDEILTFENNALIHEHMQRGHEFEDKVVWKTKDKFIDINCKVVPVNIPISKKVYYVYCYNIASKSDRITSSVSFHNFTEQRNIQKKPRRSTVRKLHNLLLDSPITKVITLLLSARNDSITAEVSTKIETAIQILRNTELYTPQLREDDPLLITDPIISDLLESLISVSSNENKSFGTPICKQSTSKTSYLTQYPTHEKLFKSPRGPEELEELLDSSFDWDFDIFKLETLTNRRTLFFLGAILMDHYRVAERLGCDEKTLQNWLTIMEANYNIHVSYHNSTHASDVLQATACFMRSKRLQMILDPFDEVAALIAAIAHDIGHPGKSSQFLCNANNKLAILYNDLSVLESHHSALTFKVTLSDDNVNIFKNLDRDIYKTLRQNIIDMILATEMTKHFEHLAKFVNIYSNQVNDEIESCDEDLLNMFLLPENVTLTKRMMIKCADVSNPTRQLRLYVEWTRRIAEEYFDQTDEEKRRMMPVMMPMFDRGSCSIPKLQIGFVDYIINDMMEAWDAFIILPELIGNMRENYKKWKQFHEQGIISLEDIEKLQQTPELQLYKKVVNN